MLRSLRPLRPLVALALLAQAPPAAARFLIEDADQMDPEVRLGTETYNDRLSYRWPVAWERRWDAADAGVRLNAGSLNVNRFDYAEDVKVEVGREADASFGFRETRREDFVESRTEREVRAGYRVLPPLRASLLGDGGTFKEYGDLGVALALEASRAQWVELRYWSVDHYYATKKSEPGDRRSRPAATTALQWDWRFGGDEGARLVGSVEDDRPMRWERYSRGYVYDNVRRTASLRIEAPAGDGWRYFLAGEQERKREARRFVDTGAEESLQRTVTTTELGGVREREDAELAAGLVGIRRDARWVSIEAGPQPSRRREGAVYATVNRPFEGSARHRWQTGLHVDHVRLDEERRFVSTEAKAQLAWEYRYGARAAAFVNTTWDIDQLGRDFPYERRPFRPWGGGNVQFIATF